MPKLAVVQVPARAPTAHARGLSRTNRTVSRAQQRLLFARYGDAAKAFTSKGRYGRLPERRRKAA